MSRKPSALARELLRNFPKGRRRRAGRRRRGKGGDENGGAPETEAVEVVATDAEGEESAVEQTDGDRPAKKRRSRRGRRSKPKPTEVEAEGDESEAA